MRKKNGDQFTFRDLAKKDVINKSDGKKLGHVCDVGIDPFCGSITSIMVPQPGSFFRFNDNCTVIPFDRIEKMGEDVIIVDAPGPGGEM